MNFVYLFKAQQNPATAERTDPFLRLAMTYTFKTVVQTHQKCQRKTKEAKFDPIYRNRKQVG